MPNFDSSLAVVIGINKYCHGIVPLTTAFNDATELAHLLKTDHQYTVELLLDQSATFDKLIDLLENSLPQKVGEGDRLLFYFAGHGIALNGDDGPEGYLIPQDAELGKVSSYLPMSRLHEALAKLPCRHFLAILDCCFAGAFRWSSTRDIAAVPENLYVERYERFLQDKAWQVLTSAAADQKALDLLSLPDQTGSTGEHSPFALALMQALKGAADSSPPAKEAGQQSGDGVITATELYLYLRDSVEPDSQKYAKRQTPGLWPLKNHDKGEYIFLTPGREVTLKKAPDLDRDNNPYRGLEAYEERHSKLFFGRAEHVKNLYEDYVSEKPLTVVLGASGTGKSSLVKAGLIPYLKNQDSQHKLKEKWHILAPIRPGNAPLTALAKAILTLVDETDLEAETHLKAFDEILKIRQNQFPKDFVTAWNESSSKAKLVLIVDCFQKLNERLKGYESDRQIFQNLLDLARNRINSLRQDLQQQGGKIAQIISEWSKLNQDVKLFLVIDQSEELVTHGQRKDERETFLQQLEQTLSQDAKNFRLVFTLRLDFEPLVQKELPKTLQSYWTQARFIVPPMNQDELRQAIEGPAAEKMLFFESENPERPLVEQLINEVVQMPGALPLLSFTLSELYIRCYKRFQNEDKKRALTEYDYKYELHGVVGSLRKRATDEYSELPEPEQQTLRRVMLRMVALEGGEIARRRVPESELFFSTEEDERVQRVVNRFVEARLLVKGTTLEGETYVEPAHDALVRGWEQIKTWLEERQPVSNQPPRLRWQNRNSSQTQEQLKVNLPLQRELAIAAKQWNRNKQDKRSTDWLWDDDPRLPLVEQARKAECDNWLNSIETEFVDRSIRQKRFNRNRARGITVSVIAGLSVLTVTASVQAQLSSLREKAAVARNLLSTDPVNGLVLAIQATGQNRTWLPWEPLNPVQSVLRDAVEIARERNIFQGQKGRSEILAIAISPDSKTIVIGGYNGIQFSDLQGNLISERVGDSVHSLAFSPDSEMVVSSGTLGDDSGYVIQLWNSQGNPIGRPLQTHENGVAPSNSIAFSSDSKTIISVISDGTVQFRDLKGNIVRQLTNQSLKEQQYSVHSVAFSPDSKTIAVGGDGTDGIGNVYLWNLQNNTISQPLEGLPGKVIAIAFSPNGEKIASVTDVGDDNSSVMVWGLQGNLIDRPFEENGYPLTSVAFSPNSERIAFGSDGTIRLWDLQQRSPVGQTFQGHSGNVNPVAFSTDGKTIASGAIDGTIWLWDLQGNSIAQTFQRQSHTSLVAFSPDNKTLLASSGDGSVQLLSLEGSIINDILQGNEEAEYSIAFSHNSGMVVRGRDNGVIEIRDLQGDIIGEPFQQKGVRSVAFSTDDRMIASGSGDGTLQLWDLQGNPVGSSFQTRGGEVLSMTFSPDDRTIAIGNFGGIEIVSNLQGRTSSRSLQGSQSAMISVAFSPNGKMLVSGSLDGTVWLWNLQKNSIGIPLRGHGSSVESVAFSPNGKMIVSGSDDNTVRLWDLQGNPIGQPFQVGSYVNSVAFSPDGKTIVIGSINGIQLLQGGNSQDWLQTACNRLQYHPVFREPQTELHHQGIDTCQKYVWSHR